MLSQEAIQVLQDLNPWWKDPTVVRPEPPPYRRQAVRDLSSRLSRRSGLIEVIRGPRQVGKTTGIHQIIQDLLRSAVPGTEILLVRFDLEVLRNEPAALRSIFQWFAEQIRRHPQAESPFVFLDEIHKLRRWDEEVKHLTETFALRLLLTGSSSVRVARGGRESLAGRVFTTELSTFAFREVIEAWHPKLGEGLPPPITFGDVFDEALTHVNRSLDELPADQQGHIRGVMDRYFLHGGYPRLYTGEVGEDRWADYLTQTMFENVLGADIPDLFPVENTALLRYIYLEIARRTGQEIAQNKLAQAAVGSGYSANQPTVGRYLRYLADALLIREFRRYPLAKKLSARVPAKITVADLGVRNAIFRGAPSLWGSDPTTLGPLVETLVQSRIRDHNLQVHFYREYEDPSDRRSPLREVDFIAERVDGSVLPIEVKFRKRIDVPDLAGVRAVQSKFRVPLAVIVTRDLSRWHPESNTLYVPLQNFLLAFTG